MLSIRLSLRKLLFYFHIFWGQGPSMAGGSMATPSMARGDHRTPFPCLSKTDANSDCWRGPPRWPGVANEPPTPRLYPNDRRGSLATPGQRRGGHRNPGQRIYPSMQSEL